MINEVFLAAMLLGSSAANGPGHEDCARVIFEEAWTQQEFERVGDCVAPGGIFHFRGKEFPNGPQHLVEAIHRWHAAFGDFSLAIEDMFGEDDRLVVRLRMQGKHVANWRGIPATDRWIDVSSIMILRFEQGRVVEVWEDYDEYGLRRQLAAPD